jgi:hypothetical protein
MTERLDRLIWRAIGVLAAIDLFFIVVDLTTGGRISLLSLNEEQNLATWYKSTKLFLVGAFAIIAYYLEDSQRLRDVLKLKYRKLWLVIGGLFIYLSADDAGTIHERFGRYMMGRSLGSGLRESLLGGDTMKDAFAWVILLSPFILASFIFLLVFLHSRMRHSRGLYTLVIAGTFIYFLSILLEATVYFTPPIARWQESEMRRYLTFTSVEGLTEVIGSTLFLAAIVLFIRFLVRARSKGLANGWSSTGTG